MQLGILFDLDGTLLDTLEDLKDAVNYALARFGYPPRSREEVRRFVGNGAGKLMARSAPEGADCDALLQCFSRYYNAHCADKTAPYAGIPQALAALRGRYPMAVVSNKPDEAVKQLCQAYFPGMHARGEGKGCPRKPAPDMLLQVVAELDVDSCIYVGDSEVDVQTARNAGVPCLSVLWGFRDLEAIRAAGGNRFCPSPEALPEMIERMAGKFYGE